MNQLTPKQETNSDAQASPGLRSAPKGRRLFAVARVLLLIFLLGAMGAWAVQWARTAVLFVHETDARIMADLVAVSSEVDGRLNERLVEEGQTVSKGQILAVIDSRAAMLALSETEAERGTIRAELVRIAAETRLIAEQIETHVASERSKLSEVEANQTVFAHELKFVENDFRRIEKLAKSGTVSTSRLDRARTDFLKARQEFEKAGAEIVTARAALSEAQADRARLSVKQAEKAELGARLAEVEARIERQSVDVADRTIISPVGGVVGRVFADPGEYVRSGQRLVVLHDPTKIWVETNIRETEIGRLEVGQPVNIEVDAYPEIEFEGRVTRIGNAATSQFALLPRLNETGAFTKVTQRIQVRVALDQHEDKLKPGMMVEIYIDDGTANNFWPWLR